MPFKTPLDARHEIGTEYWVLLAPLEFEWLGTVITVPAGFRTDYCSVPRLPICYSLFGNIGQEAGTVHDWLYNTGTLSKDEADRCFYTALCESGIEARTASLMYQGVKVGGWKAWSDYRSKDHG